MSMQGRGSYPDLTEIRAFLRSDSAEELVRAQLLNNMKNGTQFSYTDFCQSPVDKKWYCWYLTSVEDATRIRETKGGSN